MKKVESLKTKLTIVIFYGFLNQLSKKKIFSSIIKSRVFTFSNGLLSKLYPPFSSSSDHLQSFRF